MAQEAIAFAAPRAEEITRTVTGVAGAGIAGVAEGVIIRQAPLMGAAAPVLTWGTLLLTPLAGIAGALFTRGMIGDLFLGVAAGGTAILGYSLPALLLPATEKKAPQLTAEQRAALAAGGVKQLSAGSAALRAQAQVRAAVGAGLE